MLRSKGFKDELIELHNLSCDLQNLVDYEVLLRAGNFGGTWESSFHWNVAMRRHVVLGKGTWRSLGVRQTGSVLRGRDEHPVR